ncbi:MAG: DUF5320 family protein [bacterium]
MPRFDQTGPFGFGPRTGRGLGSCGGGMGFGRGMGYGRRFYTRGEEAKILKEEEKELGEELKAVKERIEEFKGQK